MSLDTIDTISADLLAAREALRRAESRFAEICDETIESNHNGERSHFDETKATFEGGSTRSVKLERYDLIPPEIDRALARRFGLGAQKHGPNNWRNGGAEFIVSCYNHLRSHYGSLVSNGPWHGDDDIGALLWNAGVLAWFREHKPDEYRRAMTLLNPEV